MRFHQKRVIKMSQIKKKKKTRKLVQFRRQKSHFSCEIYLGYDSPDDFVLVNKSER